MSSTGTVKWFNTTKGYGFIQPDNGGADVFVHISAVEKAGLRTLNENEKVSYDLVTEKGKLLPAIWPRRNRRFGKNPLFLVKQGIFVAISVCSDRVEGGVENV